MAQQKEEQKKLLSEVMEADQRDGLYDNHIGDTNKMVTAVEWLQKRYDKCPESFLTEDDFEQAKQMEKEQKIEFAKCCLDRALDTDIRTAFFNLEQYYNETYGNK